MRFAMLGPLTIANSGRSASVGRSQRRGLLCYLLLRPGQWVSADAIIEALWGGAEPSSARQQIQTSVHAIRTELRRLGGEDVLHGGGPGYRIDLGRDQLDLTEFVEQVTRARQASDARDFVAAERRLDRGLALWRGPALADASGAYVESARAGLEDQRLVATEELLATRLSLGRHHDVLAALGPLLQAHPLRERLRGQQMLALYRAGRQVDALESFRAFREALAEEHGIDPGPDLQALEHAILTADPGLEPGRGAAGPPIAAGRIDAGPPAGSTATATPPAGMPVPAQLPAAATAFVGRDEELAELDRVLADGPGRAGAEEPSTVLISTVDGAGGIGKTATAVTWAHRAREQFPDGQLYANLHGYSSVPAAQPVDVLGRFLEALGIPPEQVPVDLEAAASLYRTRLAGRRVLVLLDNANHVDQVRPLLPGHPTSLTVITSRDRLTGLIAREGAHRITLGVLTPAEALTLLGRIIGPDRVAAEPAAAAELARACGYLPLALRVVAARLCDEPDRSLADQLAQLRAAGALDVLEIEGDPQASVRAVLHQSYAALDPATRRLLRRIGLVPGPDVTVAMAGALAGEPATQAQRGLARLAAAHLVTPSAGDRFALHDLVRLFARERADDEEPPAQRAAAMSRLLGHFLASVDTAARLLYPQFVRLEVPVRSDVVAVEHVDEAAAVDWLEANLAGLVAAVRWAADAGPDADACALADALRGFFWVRRHMGDWFTTARVGLAAAERLGDPRLIAALAVNMGLAYRTQADYRAAVTYLERALAASRAAGWLEGEATALGSLAIVQVELSDNTTAIHQFTEALELNRRIGRRAGIAVVQGNLGALRLRLGDFALAVADFHESLALYREVGAHGGAAIMLTNLALGAHATGDHAEAMAYANEALALHERIGDRYGGGLAMISRAMVQIETGDLAAAAEDLMVGLDLARQTEDRTNESTGITVLGVLALNSGDPERALREFVRGVEVARSVSNKFAESECLIGAGRALLALGRVDEAAAQVRRGLEVAQRLGYLLLYGQALTALAAVLVAAGDVAAAREHADEALVVHRATGHRPGEARTLVVLGRAHSVSGRVAQATGYWQAALDMFTAMGSAEADAVRALLAGAPSSPM